MRIVAQTQNRDPSLALVGASAFAGDHSSAGIVLPSVETAERFTCRLAVVEIPYGSVAIVRSISQLLTIGATVEAEGGAEWIFELPVTDPVWHFPDGAVSWHLRTVPFSNGYSRVWVPGEPAAPTEPFTGTRFGNGPGILHYGVPAGQVEMPAGEPIGANLGTFHDMRYPWNQYSEDLNYEAEGPCQIVMYSTVVQTDPDHRPPAPPLVETSFLRKEDDFMLRFNDTARYWRVGARIVVDIYQRYEDGRCQPSKEPTAA